MTGSIGWLVVQRDVSESVRVAGTPQVWVTAIFTTPDRKIAGLRVAAAPNASLIEAVSAAVETRAAGAPSQPPSVVIAAPDIAAPVRDALRAAGVVVSVDEVATPDWAEDILGELTGQLAGRRQVKEPPLPDEWALLHQQAAAYATAAPWERRADDVHLRMELRIGSQRSDWVVVVLGNAGLSFGLALCPGRTVPAELLTADPEGPQPEGTCHLTLTSRDEPIPSELVERAARYGWPDELDVPTFLAIGPEGVQEIDHHQAEVLTVTMAAAIEHDRTGAGLGMTVTGQLILANGRRARWRAELDANVPLPVLPGLHLLSGEVRHDLLPEDTVIGLGGLPWTELADVRRRAALGLAPALAVAPGGEALPVLILGLTGADAERVARTLHDARPDGVALVDTERGVLIVVLTASGFHGVTSVARDAFAITRFRRRLEATNGWHGILVAPPSRERGDPIFGFFECVLAPLPPGSRRVPRPTGRPRSRARRPKRGR